MSTLKQLREEFDALDEGLRQKLIGGAALTAALMAALPGNAKDSAASLAATKAKLHGADTAVVHKAEADKPKKLKVIKYNR